MSAAPSGAANSLPLPFGVPNLLGRADLVMPMLAVFTAFIPTAWAPSKFGLGLLASGYSQAVAGVSLSVHHVPHDMMIGVGLVALQVVGGLRAHGSATARASQRPSAEGVNDAR